MSRKAVKIKEVLEKLHIKYNRRDCIKPDPLQFVYQYSNRADREIVAFLAAQLAYGRVQQIEKGLTILFDRMGSSPFEFARNFDMQKRQKLKNFKHRFTTGDDISDLLELLKEVLSRYGSIQKFFVQGYNSSDKSVMPALSKFCNSLLHLHAERNNGHITKGLGYLLPRPEAGSACKRLNLFLRWMIRNDDVDVGLWNSIDKAKLIVPVDVHMGRLCGILGFHDRKAICLSTAVDITEGFAEITPADPVKYDFALSRLGILGNCTGRYCPRCVDCELFEYCSREENEAR